MELIGNRCDLFLYLSKKIDEEIKDAYLPIDETNSIRESYGRAYNNGVSVACSCIRLMLAKEIIHNSEIKELIPSD